MKNTKKIISVLFVVGALSGCAGNHWTQIQCQSSDLQQTGVQDGRQGYSINRFVSYQTDCSKFNVDLDKKSYQAGWKQGNQTYCQPNNLFTVGKSGASFPEVCSSTESRQIKYNEGREIYAKISSLKTQISNIDAELNKANDLQNKYDDVLDQMAAAQKDIDFFKEGSLADDARAKYRALDQQAKLLRVQVAFQTGVDAVSGSRRDYLLHEKRKLQNRLAALEGQ